MNLWILGCLTIFLVSYANSVPAPVHMTQPSGKIQEWDLATGMLPYQNPPPINIPRQRIPQGNKKKDSTSSSSSQQQRKHSPKNSRPSDSQFESTSHQKVNPHHIIQKQWPANEARIQPPNEDAWDQSQVKGYSTISHDRGNSKGSTATIVGNNNNNNKESTASISGNFNFEFGPDSPNDNNNNNNGNQDDRDEFYPSKSEDDDVVPDFKHDDDKDEPKCPYHNHKNKGSHKKPEWNDENGNKNHNNNKEPEWNDENGNKNHNNNKEPNEGWNSDFDKDEKDDLKTWGGEGWGEDGYKDVETYGWEPPVKIVRDQPVKAYIRRVKNGFNNLCSTILPFMKTYSEYYGNGKFCTKINRRWQ